MINLLHENLMDAVTLLLYFRNAASAVL